MGIFDLLSRQDGLELPSMEEEREERVLRIEDAMHPVDVPVLESQSTVDAALQAAHEGGAKQILVHDSPFGWSSVETSTLEEIVDKGDGMRSLAHTLPETRMPPIYPDNRLEVALRHAPHWPVLAVMHRADPRQLVGLISMRDILETLGH